MQVLQVSSNCLSGVLHLVTLLRGKNIYTLIEFVYHNLYIIFSDKHTEMGPNKSQNCMSIISAWLLHYMQLKILLQMLSPCVYTDISISPVISAVGTLSPSVLLAVTSVEPGSKSISWQENPVVLQSSTRPNSESLYTVYLVANADAFQKSTADCLSPVYFTFCGAQGTGTEMTEIPLLNYI